MTVTTLVLLNILRGVLLLPLALLFLVSFVESNGLMDGVTTAKALAFSALLTASIVSLSLRLILHRAGLQITINWLDLGVFFFWAYSVLRALFTPYAVLSDVVIFSLMVCLYFLFRFFLQWDADRFHDSLKKVTALHVLTTASLVGGLLQALYGVFQLHGPDQLKMSGSFRLRGSFENPDSYAGYLASVMSFAFGIYFLLPRQDRKNRGLKYLGAATLLSGLLVLPATMIRSSWFAVLAGIIVVCLHKYEIRKKIKQYFRSRQFPVASVISGVVIILCGIAGLYALKVEAVDRTHLIWKITSNMIKESPLFGVGFDRYQVEYGNAQAAYFASGIGTLYEKQLAGNVKYAHNEYLQLWTEEGVVGLVLVVLFLLFALGAFHRDRVEAYEDDHDNPRYVLLIAARASLLAILISSLFSFPVHILPTAINLIFLLSLISCVEGYKNAVELDLQSKWLKQLGLVGMASSLLTIPPLISSYRAYAQWNSALGKTLTMNFEDALSEYDLLTNHFNEDGKFLFMHGALLSQVGRHDEAIKALEEAKKRFDDLNLWIVLGQSYEAIDDYSSAEEHYAHASNMIPHKVYPKYLLAKLYQKSGKTKDAVRVARTILQTDEKQETTAASEMKFEMKQFLQSARIP